MESRLVPKVYPTNDRIPEKDNIAKGKTGKINGKESVSGAGSGEGLDYLPDAQDEKTSLLIY